MLVARCGGLWAKSSGSGRFRQHGGRARRREAAAAVDADDFDEAGALQEACRDFVLEHLDELEGTPACDRLMDDKSFVLRMFKAHRSMAERENKRRRTM